MTIFASQWCILSFTRKWYKIVPRNFEYLTRKLWWKNIETKFLFRFVYTASMKHAATKSNPGLLFIFFLQGLCVSADENNWKLNRLQPDKYFAFKLMNYIFVWVERQNIKENMKLYCYEKNKRFNKAQSLIAYSFCPEKYYSFNFF